MAAETQTPDTAETQTDFDDEELVATLTGNMTAAGIRSWMSENGLTRSRAARKAQSVEQAIEQDRDAVVAKADELLAGAGDHHVTCTCGIDERYDEAELAIEAARAHKSANNTHFPKARDEGADGEEAKLYG